MAEFTGERVIPGQVDVDLWNEHFARYLFAGRLARHKEVLDIASGAGYGAAELARTAAKVVGIDRAAEAVSLASSTYRAPNLTFLQATGGKVPFAAGSFDLITAFEVIEHMPDWRDLIDEAARLLRPGGQFVVSTPNKLYYAESRQSAGPNPFHEHEFTFDEFQQALAERFPSILFFVQNHSTGIVFQPLNSGASAEVRLESGRVDPATAHFFLAVCALGPQIGSPTFVYLPASANVLREREQHIARLESELKQKDAWLAEQQSAHQQLLGQFRDLKDELEARNRWAQDLNSQLAASFERIQQLQTELAAEQAAAVATATAYETKVSELEAELAARTKWATETEERLTGELAAKTAELAACVELLHNAETTLEERTKWALELDSQREALESQLAMVHASRWFRMGRRFGLGPNLGASQPS